MAVVSSEEFLTLFWKFSLQQFGSIVLQYGSNIWSQPPLNQVSQENIKFKKKKTSKTTSGLICLNWGLTVFTSVMLPSRKTNFVSFPVANPYLRNASRTNKTSSSGIVREAQREANTDMKKSQKRPQWSGDPSREREKEDWWARNSCFPCCQVTAGGRFGKVRNSQVCVCFVFFKKKWYSGWNNKWKTKLQP